MLVSATEGPPPPSLPFMVDKEQGDQNPPPLSSFHGRQKAGGQ